MRDGGIHDFMVLPTPVVVQSFGAIVGSGRRRVPEDLLMSWACIDSSEVEMLS